MKNNRFINKCPDCDQEILNKEDLNYHWLYMHSQGEKQSPQPREKAKITTKLAVKDLIIRDVLLIGKKQLTNTHTALSQNNAAKFDSGYSVQKHVKESSLDGSKNYYDNFHEGNKLGSHPSHDDYGDESFA